MIEKTSIIRNKRIAWSKAHREKPYRDLALAVRENSNEPGMANAYSTIVDLAIQAADVPLPTRSRDLPRIQSTVPDHQHHIVEAAHSFVRTSREKSGVSKEDIYVSHLPLTSPIPFNRAVEVMQVWGVQEEIKMDTNYPTRLPHVTLRMHENLGTVTVFAERAVKKRTQRK